MSVCAVNSGILFSRKPCGKPATLHCGHCKIALCKEHLVPQKSGPFLCPQCDRYENDGDHDWEYAEGGWRWRGAKAGDDGDDIPAVFDEMDKEGFAAGVGGAGADAVEDDRETDGKENDFDAS